MSTPCCDTAAGHFITTAGTEWCNPSQRPSSSSSSPIIMASAQLQSDGDTPWAPAAVTYCDISLALPLQPGFGARERSAQKPQTQSSEAQGQRSARVCSSLPSQLALHCGGRRQEWHSARCTRTSPDFTAPYQCVPGEAQPRGRGKPCILTSGLTPRRAMPLCPRPAIENLPHLLRVAAPGVSVDANRDPHQAAYRVRMVVVASSSSSAPPPRPPTHPPTVACITTKGSISVG